MRVCDGCDGSEEGLEENMKMKGLQKRSESFAQWFRRTYGRPLTEADLRRLLEQEFGIKPDANGYYYRSQFEPFWKQMENPQ